MKNIREHIYLAALLQDIEKFYQRAHTENIKDECFTTQFIVDNETVFESLLGFEETELSNYGNLISEANSLASGIEDNSEITSKEKTKRLSSIFESIALTETQLNNRSKKYYTPVEPLTLAKQSFPKSTFDAPPDYKNLWSAFMYEFKNITTSNLKSFTETLLNLLFKYTWCIPSNTTNYSDVSLYDHSKMTAALAVCLYDNEQESDKQEDPFLLIGADFSGIQSYIYQIVSKYAAKSLKGRSFYLRLLADAVVNYILKELNLFRANIIYNSGGSFYLIAPNTGFVRDKLPKLMETIEQNIFDSHGTIIYLAIDHIELSKDTLLGLNDKNLAKVWTELFYKRDKKKNKKLQDIVSNNYDVFFNPMQNGIEADKITGEEISLKEKTYNVEHVGLVRNITHQQIELGKRLRDSDLLLVSDKEIPYLKSKNPIEPAKLGTFFYLLKENEVKQALSKTTGNISIITLNGKDEKCEFLKNSADDTVYGMEFYGGNYFDGGTFDEFCSKESKDVYRRLGVLRMDVDNLGAIFQGGMSPKNATLARYAALSRSFDFFFSGYINVIQQEVALNSSFIVYSGGDDLFIVASWDDAINLAKKIRDDFSAYTCYNPAFSLSGGIALITPKFPIMRGAKESDDEEKLAKDHDCKGSTKNAISFMSTPLNWDKEFPAVEKLKNKIVELTNRDALPKSFIGKVLQHLSSAKVKNHKICNLRISWLVPYDMSRMIGRYTDVEVKQLIDNYKKEACSNETDKLNDSSITTSYHPMELWALAARWAELEIRTNK